MNALKEANNWMTLYIRLRDAIEYNHQFPEDIIGVDPKILVAACVTCGVIKPWKLMDCGHCFSRGSGGRSGVYFDERNLGIQCRTCNRFHQGRQLEFVEHIIKKYGQKVLDELRRKDKLTRKRGQTELMAIALHYKDLYLNLFESL